MNRYIHILALFVFEIQLANQNLGSVSLNFLKLAFLNFLKIKRDAVGAFLYKPMSILLQHMETKMKSTQCVFFVDFGFGGSVVLSRVSEQ